MNHIFPAWIANTETCTYHVHGPIVCVYDSNYAGALIPVSYIDNGNGNGTFTLENRPYSKVFVQVASELSPIFVTPSDVRLAVATLVAACHGAAAHWWVNPKTGIDERSNPKNFSEKLMLIVTELAESMEGHRKDLMDDKLPHRKMREVELADALIRICDTAGGYAMDLAGATVEKMQFNSIRPDHKIEARLAEGGKSV